jgi:Enoyl-(Acyl carrier protein) reductase
VGMPADIAEAARFLAGPESAWITGEVINVDGGQHLRRGPDYTAMFEPMFGAAALRGLPDDHAGRYCRRKDRTHAHADRPAHRRLYGHRRRDDPGPRQHRGQARVRPGAL